MSAPISRKEVIGNATLYLGDCRFIMPSMPNVDAVITDPPYGVGFSGKAGHYRNEPSAKREDTYESYEDSDENFVAIVLPALQMAIDKAKSAAVFTSSRNVFRLQPGVLGGIFLPNGCGLSSWGFENFMHVAFYGSDPYLRTGRGSMPNGKYGIYGNDSNQIAHPCAKPLAAMEWAVNRASLNGDVVLDPFMGSGTTGVACSKLGRKFVGIEIEPKYFDLACERITDSQRQERLFA